METPPYANDSLNPDDENKSEYQDDAELVEQAKRCYRVGIDATARWRADALEDLNFLAGDQWDSNIKGMRDAQGRPALTVNRLPQLVRQVTNEERQSKPSITVNPIDSQGDIRTADVLQGIIRNIEYSSNADSAYAAGGQSAAITGLGYWDVSAEYEGPRSFEQKLTIRRIRNPHSVVMDPSAKELAGDDARWTVSSIDISKAEWEALCPGEDIPRGGGGWDGAGDQAADWTVKDGVRIHEYRWIAEKPDTLFDLSQATPELQLALKAAGIDLTMGSVLASEVGDDFAQKLTEAGLPSRETVSNKAYWAKIAGSQVIERGELAGKYLQLVRVVGTELEINGAVIYEGVIRHAKDTQRALNYFVSAEAEAIALAPKAPFIAAEGQIEDYETEWEQANQKPTSVLRYKPLALGGVAVPPPQRVMAEANISAITQARQQAGQDLNEVTGIYPTQYGGPSPEQSGRAILARQNQGQISNFHFTDNLAQAVRYTGRILIDLIPKIYSGPRMMRIVGEDGSQEMAPVNGATGEFRGEQIGGQDGAPVIQLDAGRYDVAVSMGPSYLSRRQEAAAEMLELVRVNPAISQIAGDLLVASMDIPGGDAIAERMRKMLPPELRPPEDNQPPPQVLANQLQQAQGMLQQSQAMIGKLTEALHNAHDRIDAKEQDIASKERIALIGAQTELVKTAATINSKETQAMLDRQSALIHKRLELDGLAQAEDQESTKEEPTQGDMNGSPGPIPSRNPGQFPGNPNPGGFGPGGGSPSPGR